MTQVTQIGAPFAEDMPLLAARNLLRTMADAGATCPCCTQNVKVYKRTITANMARMLIRMYRAAGGSYVYLPDLRDGNSAMDQTVMQHWGLIEELKEKREDGGRIGWWRVTHKGAKFLLGEEAVPKHAKVYNGRCLGHAGALMTIYDALGTKFNYEELMAA